MPQGNSLMTSRKCNKQNREFTATDNGRTTTGRDGTDRQTDRHRTVTQTLLHTCQPTESHAYYGNKWRSNRRRWHRQTDRQTDRQTPYRYTDTAAYMPTNRIACLRQQMAVKQKEMAQTDRQMDGQTPYHYLDPAATDGG